MPLFEVTAQGLVPFRQVLPGADLHESEIEDLVWSDLEAFLGETLFPIARQARLTGGGRPDVLALDESGRVVVIEIKRDVDRSQLAQCLEYAGWARSTNLDELAALYHGGSAAFFTDWQDFTDTNTPVVVNRAPRIVLVARSFEDRTRSALDFLRENGLPVSVVPVAVYEDAEHHRFIDVEADHEPTVGGGGTAGDSASGGPTPVMYQGRRAQIADLIAAGLVEVGESLEFPRPRRGELFRATVLADGTIQTEDGQIWPSPSRAAMSAANVPSYDGWHAWRLPRLGGIKLDQLRQRLVAEAPEPFSTPGDDGDGVA
ncbi:MAG TPA: hypothetical protein VNQ73_23485 [Ilumatobacter sp.]|nr:hypothetical protein [Ilumatobacter sp.]